MKVDFGLRIDIKMWIAVSEDGKELQIGHKVGQEEEEGGELFDEIKDSLDYYANQEFFEQPSAYRTLYGLIRRVNYQINRSALQSAVMFANNNLFVILNCDESEVEEMLSKPIPSDEYQMGVSQNLLDFTNVDEIKVQITQFLDFLLYRYFHIDNVKDITNILNTMGLMKEHISLVHDKEIYK